MQSSRQEEQVLVFTRYPQPGSTKTRLARVLGNRGAADLQKKLTEITLTRVRQFLQKNRAAAVVYHEGGSRETMFQWLGPDLDYRAQSGGDLGQRLSEAFGTAFGQGCVRVVIIGADCPDLLASHLEEAFTSLRSRDLVLGPATDGGYYLVGLSRPEPALFAAVPWGTGNVLQKTLEIAVQKGLSFRQLETLRDVDRPEDLQHFDYHTGP
jgi:rSAM/selenodomain-associated transferase 1